MIFKNAEFHNVSEIIENEDGSYSFLRVPKNVYENLEKGKGQAKHSTGVEIRFVLKSEKAVIKMSALNDSLANSFHVYRGGIQGGWEDHEVNKNVTTEIKDFEIKKSTNDCSLKKMSEAAGTDWNPEVIRIIFDLGSYNIYDIIGDIEPPKKQDKPQKTILFYGSSITHGSNSIDASHSWASLIGHNLNMDVRNLGFAGSCCMEPEIAEYIANEGKNNKWAIAVLELGINVLDWDEEHIRERVENILTKVATTNPEKNIFLISPFIFVSEVLYDNTNGQKWRRLIKETYERLNYKNVTYIDGLEVLDNISYISADEVHPNIYGVSRIAEVLTEKIRDKI